MEFQIRNNLYGGTMKVCLLRIFIISELILLVPGIVFAQKKDAPEDAPQKFALVIGNGAYTGDLPPLKNPVNDANDIAAVLKQMGFSVDKILNGTFRQMEDAVLRLSDNLGKSKNAYGFFFYAGHGSL